MRYITTFLLILYWLIPLWIVRVSQLPLPFNHFVKRVFITILLIIATSFAIFTITRDHPNISDISRWAGIVVFVIYLIIVYILTYLFWPRSN